MTLAIVTDLQLQVKPSSIVVLTVDMPQIFPYLFSSCEWMMIFHHVMLNRSQQPRNYSCILAFSLNSTARSLTLAIYMAHNSFPFTNILNWKCRPNDFFPLKRTVVFLVTSWNNIDFWIGIPRPNDFFHYNAQVFSCDIMKQYWLLVHIYSRKEFRQCATN